MLNLGDNKHLLKRNKKKTSGRDLGLEPINCKTRMQVVEGWEPFRIESYLKPFSDGRMRVEDCAAEQSSKEGYSIQCTTLYILERVRL